MIAFEAAMLAIGALLITGPRMGAPDHHHGVMLGGAAGVLFGVSDVAIKALTGAHGLLAVATSPWLAVTVTASVDTGSLVLAVEDTGGGIAPESLLKIFSAGFTTKPKGHGYGLHSSALAAEQLGGTLRCSSEGLGRGAMFILRVPTEPGRAHE